MLDFNSGMGYSMMGMGMMPMMGMGMTGMNSMGGSAYGNSGNYWQQLKEEYCCEDCFQHGPTIPECHFHIMPLPPETPAANFAKKLLRMFGL